MRNRVLFIASSCPSGFDLGQHMLTRRHRWPVRAAIAVFLATLLCVPGARGDEDGSEKSDGNSKMKTPDDGYRRGYDPENLSEEQRATAVILPQEAWGEAVDGLQAALSLPPILRMNEVATPQLVVRNAGKKTIRFFLSQISRSADATRRQPAHLQPGA